MRDRHPKFHEGRDNLDQRHVRTQGVRVVRSIAELLRLADSLAVRSDRSRGERHGNHQRYPAPLISAAWFVHTPTITLRPREASVPLITGPTKWPLSPPRATGARAKELLIDAHGALARPSEPAFGPHSNAVKRHRLLGGLRYFAATRTYRYAGSVTPAGRSRPRSSALARAPSSRTFTADAVMSRRRGLLELERLSRRDAGRPCEVWFEYGLESGLLGWSEWPGKRGASRRSGGARRMGVSVVILVALKEHLVTGVGSGAKYTERNQRPTELQRGSWTMRAESLGGDG